VALAAIASPALPYEPHLFIVTDDGKTGSTAAMALDPPWSVTPGLETVGRNPRVRHFFGRHYVINRYAETIQVIDPDTFDTTQTLQVGPTPRDIAVVGARQAYVTRYDSAELIELDPTSGAITGTVDLSSLADEDGIPEMDAMTLDGYHLFIQLQRLDRNNPATAAGTPAFLAVVDVRTGQLVDVDPGTPGAQAIRLAGKRPAYKMIVERDRRRLYLSVPAGFFDGVDGAVEEIDLDTLASRGFITTESSLQTLDLSGFVLVSADKGFIVTHTEIVESSHVTGFSRQTGTPVSQIYTTLFGSIRNLDYDPTTSRVFLPDSTPDGTLGVLVFHAVTDKVLTPTPVDVAGPPVDLVVARPVTPGEATDLRVNGVDPKTGRLSLNYLPACQAADHHVVFGPLAEVASYAYAGQECQIGNLGSYDDFDPGPESAFFLVVGTDGVATEGSYGTATGAIERPENPRDGACPSTRDLSLRCD
jgi:hypothetical protein